MIKLTRRERQVAVMIAEGKSSRKIAEELKISVKTYDTHRGHILKKLKLANSVELARHAIREGWVVL